MKSKAALKRATNSREYKLLKKLKDLRCPFCPPHGGENKTRHAKHGPSKPKYKNRKN